MITIRRALLTDALAIAELINHYASRGLMLPKNPVQIYENLREFVVAVDEEGALMGCGGLRLMDFDLAEVRSLAVSERARGQGIGQRLVNALIDEAHHLGIGRVFALTYEERFFRKLGFDLCDRHIFPQKVWADCRLCPKRHHCDEIAMIRYLKEEEEVLPFPWQRVNHPNVVMS